MNSDTLLLRQVHPKFFQDGQVSSQAFTPFPKDEGKLSVYDGDLISAADSHAHYTLKLESVGAWAVTPVECDSLELPSRPDPLEDSPSHAIIDFTAQPKNARKLAKKLRDLAVQRGCIYSQSSG